MSSDSEIEKVVQELLAACQADIENGLRDALRRGIKIGSERNLNVIAHATQILAGITIRPASRTGNKKKGCAEAVRKALARVAYPEPAEVTTIAEYVHRHIDTGVTVSQVRSALKNLVATGEAENVAWGKYRANVWLKPPNGHKVQLIAGAE